MGGFSVDWVVWVVFQCTGLYGWFSVDWVVWVVFQWTGLYCMGGFQWTGLYCMGGFQWTGWFFLIILAYPDLVAFVATFTLGLTPKVTKGGG